MIQVQSPGLFTTVQDPGRYGYGPLGVSPSGAADPIALRLGNMLVENPVNAPALEMTLLGGTFLFTEGALIALSGSDSGATVDGSPLSTWAARPVRAGQTVKTGPTKSGARCYLAVRGGIAVEPFLGSASTHILSHLGGVEGRQLRRGDVLNVGTVRTPASTNLRSIAPEIARQFAPRKVLRTTIAPQTNLFSAEAIETFYSVRYRVTEQSNRIGLRLEGPSIGAPYEGHMVTEGVSLGAVQIPVGGKPIILFVEQQTTGGYPKIANVITADLPAVGQLRPNDVIRFELTSPEQAQALIREQERMLKQIDESFSEG